jgi:glucokinase
MNLDRGRAPESCAIGLDVGGTKIAGGIVGFPGRAQTGAVLGRKIIATLPKRGGQAVLSDALDLTRQLITEAEALDLVVDAIGVGVCELVNLEGQVTSANQVAWSGLPAQAAFAKLAPAWIESDVRAPAFAEAHLGAGLPFSIFVYVTIGTGISYCLVQDGKPYVGAHGNALILASSPFTTTCTTCGTVLSPILEDYAAGPALVERYNHAAGNHPTLSRAEDVFSAANSGDGLANEIIDSGGHALGVSVGWLVNVLDPEAVIVGGGLGSAGGAYWDSFTTATRNHIWSHSARDLPILTAGLGLDAGIVGAAAAAMDRLEESQGSIR